MLPDDDAIPGLLTAVRDLPSPASLAAGFAFGQEADVGAALRLPPPDLSATPSHTCAPAGPTPTGWPHWSGRRRGRRPRQLTPPLERTRSCARRCSRKLGRPAAAESAWEEGDRARGLHAYLRATRHRRERRRAGEPPPHAEPYLSGVGPRRSGAAPGSGAARGRSRISAVGRPGRAASAVPAGSRRHDVQRGGRCRAPGARGRSRSRRRRLRQPWRRCGRPSFGIERADTFVSARRAVSAADTARAERDAVTLHRDGVPRPRSTAPQRFPLRARPGAARRMGGGIHRRAPRRSASPRNASRRSTRNVTTTPR